jgi:hypothetical protein
MCTEIWIPSPVACVLPPRQVLAGSCRFCYPPVKAYVLNKNDHLPL